MYALEIRQLRKTYSNQFEALKGIDLVVNKGDFFALLGANGAGKSTTIGLITTLLTKTSGFIAIDGYSLDQQPEKAKLCIGLVPQEINLNIFETCEQVLLGQAGYYGIRRQDAKPQADMLLHQLGLKEKRQTQVRHLSGGMKRRLMIARALIHQPKLLILDEPTAGVDVEIRHHMWEFLAETNKQGTTIILTTHYLEEAEKLCNHIAIIDEGKIIKNSSMQELLQTVHHQVYIFTTLDPIEHLPMMHPFRAKKLSMHTFELRIEDPITLNEIFTVFAQHNLRIHNVRNKTNRLEELFLDLIKRDFNAH